jgi:hypothetical protein
MDEAGHASTDCTVLPPSDALKEFQMFKLSCLVYPAVALLSLAAAVSAHAQEITPDDSATQVWVHTKTRAEVVSELAAARADKSLGKPWSREYNPALSYRTVSDRAEVKADAKVARRSGYTDAMYGEDSGAFYLAHQPTVRDASRVLAGVPARPAQ